MNRRRLVQAYAALWAVAGWAVAWSSFSEVNEDARLLVGVVSLLAPLAAAAAAVLLGRGQERLAGSLLLISVLTPTYFAWVLNVPALVLGLGLLATPAVLLGRATRNVASVS